LATQGAKNVTGVKISDRSGSSRTGYTDTRIFSTEHLVKGTWGLERHFKHMQRAILRDL